MFAGIVETTGKIVAAAPQGDGVRLRIEAPALGLDDVAAGDSIAVQGICLTVVAKGSTGFEADVSRATLSVTSGLEAGREVNVEKSLRFGDRVHGHLVAGHVDGVGQVVALEELGGSARLVVEAPGALRRHIASKGSIAVDGVSLTVNAVEGGRFEVNLIPHTRAVTSFRSIRPGDRVNLEVDMIARYVAAALAT
jgi:riboflavin synthase